MRKPWAAIPLLLLIAACGDWTGSTATDSSTQQPAATAGGSACDTLHARINDQHIYTIGDARTWGPQPRGGSSRYAGYRASDKLAVCLESSGEAVGIFLKDGRRETLWHQSPADHIILP